MSKIRLIKSAKKLLNFPDVWIKAWIKLRTKTVIPIINFVPISTSVYTVLECNINCLESQCVMYVLFYVYIFSENKHYCHCSPALQQYNGQVRSWRFSYSPLWIFNSHFKYCHSGLPIQFQYPFLWQATNESPIPPMVVHVGK